MDINKEPSPLNERDLLDLLNSGLTEEQAIATGHFSANAATTKELIGFRLEGLIFNYRDHTGKLYLRSDGKPFYRIKPDYGENKNKDDPRYLSPKNDGCRPYFSVLYKSWTSTIKSTKIEIWETEGEKKGDCGCAYGLAVIAFGGVSGWVDNRSNDSDSIVLPELDVIEYKGRRVNLCFDSDIIEKHQVKSELAKRAKVLKEKGAFPYLILLPNEINGSKNGLDDFVYRHGIEALNFLAKESNPVTLNNEGDKATLKLEEPDNHYKAVLAWSVLKESFALRPSVGWYEWQGTHWKLKTEAEFEQILTRFMDAQNWKKRNSGDITSVIRELKSRLIVRDDLWNPFGKLAFNNGTLDVLANKFIPSHSQMDRLTRLRSYSFDLEAQCPTWLNFIDQAMGGDIDLINLIRSILRYVVLPRRRDRKSEIEKSFDFYGRKGTGKGTTIDVITNLVGIENVGSASVDTFKSPVGLGELIDKDIALDSDASGFLDNIGNYNKVVSNEPVGTKKLYQNLTTCRLGVVIVRAYNSFISVPDGSEGLDRRMIIVPFNNSPKTIDTNLSEKLEAETAGIFAWCFSLSQVEMKQNILRSGSIQSISEMSIERFEANNPEFRFLSDTFPNGEDSIKAGNLYQRYIEWCQKNQHKPKSNVKFAPSIQSFGCDRSKGKINGCFYYNVPNMDKFDVSAHLGIVNRQFKDICRDSSNPDTDTNRDSCRQLEAINSYKNSSSELSTYKRLDLQPSTTVPISLAVTVPTVLDISEPVSTIYDEVFEIGDRLEITAGYSTSTDFGLEEEWEDT